MKTPKGAAVSTVAKAIKPSVYWAREGEFARNRRISLVVRARNVERREAMTPPEWEAEVAAEAEKALVLARLMRAKRAEYLAARAAWESPAGSAEDFEAMLEAGYCLDLYSEWGVALCH